MPEHLLLPDRTTIGSRRAGGGGGTAPVRNPRQHGTQLGAGLTNVLAARRLDTAIDPDLVFKIRAADRRINDETLILRGLLPLAETTEYIYFVLSHDEGEAFGDALRAYSSGEDLEGAPETCKVCSAQLTVSNRTGLPTAGDRVSTAWSQGRGT